MNKPDFNEQIAQLVKLYRADPTIFDESLNQRAFGLLILGLSIKDLTAFMGYVSDVVDEDKHMNTFFSKFKEDAKLVYPNIKFDD